jgi:hypothetical protein
MDADKTTVAQTVLAIFAAGGVFGVAGLISAYNATVYPAASVGLGIAAVGFSLSGAACSASAVWLLRAWLLRPVSTVSPVANEASPRSSQA